MKLSDTLDLFLKSPDFETGIISATKAGWNNDKFYVELLEDGHFFVVDGKHGIGNKYESAGIVLVLPSLDCDGYQEVVVEGDMGEGVFFALAFSNERGELTQELRDQFALKAAA